jgi:hypothetical protein
MSGNQNEFSRPLPLILEIDTRIFLDECTTEMRKEFSNSNPFVN